MSVRLIALDMDGTLLNAENAVTPFSSRVLLRAAQAGIALSFATGRSVCELDDLRAQLPFIRYAITENGGVVRDLSTGEILFERGLHVRDVLAIYDVIAPFDPMFEILADGRIYVQQSCLDHLHRYDVVNFAQIVQKTRTGVADIREAIAARTAPVTKIHIFFPSPLVRNKAMAAAASMPYAMTHQLRSNLEFNPLGVNKGEGVDMLAKRLSLPLEDVMAIGDNMNDVPMLKKAGVSVAMANAEPSAKNAAKHITLSNNEDGAAIAILKWALNTDE